jgi:hypothetical protein
MARYVVTGLNGPASRTTKRASKEPAGVKVVARSDTAMLVETDAAGLDALRRLYPEATIAPEARYSIPRESPGLAALRAKHAR